MAGESNLDILLKTMTPKLNAGVYVFCSILDVQLVDSKDIIMIFKEEEGHTVIVKQEIADKLKFDYSFVAAWITLTVHSSLQAVGLTAAFSKALTDGNGIVSVEGGRDILTKKISKYLAISEDLSNPYSYLKDKYLSLSINEDLFGQDILLKHESNFRIERKDIKDAYYDPKKKWGMGPYPHDGKVYIKLANNKKREFIILGNQKGAKIADWILLNLNLV